MDFFQWKKYFTSNESHFEDINWETPDRLTPEEKSLITSSLQQFQKGEQSEGRHLFSFARSFPDHWYLEAIRLFIVEEQTHARVLGKFMEKEGIPKIKHHWVDHIFRWLRKLAGLENTIIVLVTAEIIAKQYYKALRDATGSVLLKQLCIQILKDEDQHILFQSYALHVLYHERRSWGRLLSRGWHFILMAGTILIVWMHHRRVLKAGAYSFLSFSLSTMLVFLESDKLIREQDSRRLSYV